MHIISIHFQVFQQLIIMRYTFSGVFYFYLLIIKLVNLSFFKSILNKCNNLLQLDRSIFHMTRNEQIPINIKNALEICLDTPLVIYALTSHTRYNYIKLNNISHIRRMYKENSCVYAAQLTQ